MTLGLAYLQPISQSPFVGYNEPTLSRADIIGKENPRFRNWFQNKLAVRSAKRNRNKYRVERHAFRALGVPEDLISVSEALESVASIAHGVTNSLALTPTPLAESHSHVIAGLAEESRERFESMSFLEPYRYDSLPTSKSIIRILRIESGKETDPLTCTLSHVNLAHNKTPYEAISYVWGSNSRETPINCDGRSLKITKSLHGALRRVRLATGPRYVWADAVCINQDDDKERSSQVSLMLDIYQNATRTLVWLGDDCEENAFSAFSLICILVNTHKPGDVVAEFINHEMTVMPDTEKLLSISSWTRLFDALAAMYMRPWFWRLWVVQEIVVSPLAIIMWGQTEILWSLVGWASEWLRTNEHYILRYFGISGIYNAHLMEYLSRREDISNFSLLRLLGLTRQFGATDSRDRIFALLGIPSRDTGRGAVLPFIRPNYELPVSDLYHEFAKLVMDRDNDLQVLSAVQHGITVDESVPSWVPLWDNVHCHALAPSEPGPNHEAADGLPMHETKTGNSNHLILKGIPFDTIAKYTEIMSPYNFREKLRGQSLGVFAFTKNITAFLPDCWDEDTAKELAWTLTAGKDWYGMLTSEEQSPSHWADFAAYWHEFSTPDPDLSQYQKYREGQARYYEVKKAGNGDDDRFLEAASNACVGRRLFVTERGRLGLGPAALREGDRCCVLFGGIVPFVLRRQDESGAMHRLVGECYMRDVMRGQVVEQWRNGEFPTQDFCIC